MPTEPDKTTVDPRDAEIFALKLQVTELQTELNELNEHCGEISDQLDMAQNQLSIAPSGDYCVLAGKTYPVVGTVTTRFASDEGRKNNTEDDELVILKR